MVWSKEVYTASTTRTKRSALATRPRETKADARYTVHGRSALHSSAVTMANVGLSRVLTALIVQGSRALIRRNNASEFEVTLCNNLLQPDHSRGRCRLSFEFISHERHHQLHQLHRWICCRLYDHRIRIDSCTLLTTKGRQAYFTPLQYTNIQ